ncbi:T9SS type A sorting domain-containing protein [Paraflavitalea sp. CAU 1676]|uniref:T9SS type A sorting domain-containing protein n=1 Tax=Paraflavitalea sp. CAU 1676 TaxID=3032598 RepID=UPI0023DA12C0|nr:T9SS type A sorting domain-containing protein [Paraflavitalea sp. CAU 1676]MDF2187527.1 T9SS type A sorting domain-containing protein [Paraflavitalea sp. CAU 1676]
MRLIYTLSFILILSNTVRSQERTTPSSPPGEPVAKIIKFYPNPATSFITFDFQRGYDKNYTLQIFNLPGKKVHEVTEITPKTTVNLSDFFRGIYFFQLRDKAGRLIEAGKFQVSK